MENKKYEDFISGVILSLLAIYIIVQSLLISKNSGEDFYKSAGLFPLILGIALLLCSSLLIFGSVKEDGVTKILQDVKLWTKKLKNKEVIKMIGGIVILGIYSFGLLGRMHFVISTGIFITTLMIYLKSTSIIKILLTTVVAVGFIYYLFGILFKIPLP